MINIVTDTGYQGLQKIHARTQMPKKRNQKHPLTKEDKKTTSYFLKKEYSMKMSLEV
jgi:hypothetical protein